MDLIAMIIATLTPAAVYAALGLAIVFYLLWGWLGALFGLVVGYGTGVYLTQWYGGVPLSPHVKGWLSLVAFLGGLTLLAILTR
ncbi:MAG: hypothetical protein ACXWJV_09795 [Hyphomicrobium sp.]